MTEGVVFIAIGHKFHKMAAAAIRSVRRYTDRSITVIGGKRLPSADHINSQGPGGLGCRAYLSPLSPYDRTLLIDADCVVRSKRAFLPFKLLDDFDLAMCHTRRHDWRAKCDTFPQLNCGVMFIKKSDRMDLLFAKWQDLYGDLPIHFRGRGWLTQPSFNSLIQKERDIRFMVLPPEYNYMPAPGPRLFHPSQAYIIHNRQAWRRVNQAGEIDYKWWRQKFWGGQ